MANKKYVDTVKYYVFGTTLQAVSFNWQPLPSSDTKSCIIMSLCTWKIVGSKFR